MSPQGVHVARRVDSGGSLRLALPRGSLFAGCLDALDRAGFDTTKLRSESRALIFDLDGLIIVTVRPSDVPTYVEAGAADLGITGKDVLADAIVDLVDTGRTLEENGLEVIDEIAECTARLVANRIAHKLRVGEIDAMVERLRDAAVQLPS